MNEMTIERETPTEKRNREQESRDRINQLLGFFVGLFVALAIKVLINYLMN